MVGNEHRIKLAQINTEHIKWGDLSAFKPQGEGEGLTEVLCDAMSLLDPAKSAATVSESGLSFVVVD